MKKKLLYALATFCIACAAVPLPFGILNAGGIALLFAGFGIIILTKFWSKISGIIPLEQFLIFCVSVGISYITVASAFMIESSRFNPPPEEGEMAVIVLGGKIVGDAPSLMLKRRLDGAYRYMLENPRGICIVTGGQSPGEEYSEAAVMKAYLVSLGIDESRIILEEKSRNTQENLEFAAELMSSRDMPVTLSTDGFHQLRGAVYAMNAGLSRPYAISSYTPWGLMPAYWAREVLALAAAGVNTYNRES